METTATITHAVNNFYDRVLLDRALPLLLHARYGQVRDIPRGNTDVIKFRKYGSLSVATTPLTEGTTPAGSSLSITDLTATVKQYGDFLQFSDFLQMTTLDPILIESAELLGEQAGNTLDVLCRDVLVAGTAVHYSDITSPQVNAARTDVVATDVISIVDLNKVIRTLKNENVRKITSLVPASVGVGTVPVAPCYVGIVHPNISYTLTGLTGFEPIEKYVSKADAMPGEIGKYKEIRFVESTNAKVFTAGGGGAIDVYATLILGADAYGITRISGEALKNIVKPLGSAGTADPLEQRSTSGWKATFVAKILQQLFMVRIESAMV